MLTSKRWLRATGSFLGAGALLVGMMALVPAVVYSQFGFEVVTDWETEAELGTLIGSAADQLSETVQLYQNAVHTYNQMYASAQQFRNGFKMNWMTFAQRSVNNYTPNRYGETANWGSVLNGQPGASLNAWSGLTTPVGIGYDLSTVPHMPQLKNDLGLVEARDGFGEQCLQTVGSYRQVTEVNTSVLNQFDSTVADDSDSTNSEVEQLNELNVGGTQAMNEARSQGQLHACEVQARLLDQAEKREQGARLLNYYGHLEQGRQAGVGKFGSMSGTLNNYLPH